MASLKVFTVSASLLYAFMTRWPPYTSSTCPLICPRYSCCCLKYFCECFMTNEISIIETGRITSEISVMSGEIDSIMTSVPTKVATDVIICVILWFKLCPSVSTSFVIRESTSPYVLDSKYFIGIRLILLVMSLRIL